MKRLSTIASQPTFVLTVVVAVVISLGLVVQRSTVPLQTRVSTVAIVVVISLGLGVQRSTITTLFNRTTQFYSAFWFWWAVWCTQSNIQRTFGLPLGEYDQRSLEQPVNNLHGVTQKICACALRYGLPRGLRRWVLRRFLQIPDKPALTGHSLAYDIVNYYLRFQLTRYDGMIVEQKDIATLLFQMREWAPKKPLELPTVDMHIGDGQGKLPVTYLPMTWAIASKDPPIYDTKFVVRHRKTACRSRIPVFISHPWASPHTPNRLYDFERVLGILLTAIQCSIQASVLLLRSGFPLQTLLDKMKSNANESWIFPIARNVLALHVDGPEFKGKDGKYTKLPSIGGKLLMAIFEASAKIVVRHWKSYKSIRSDDKLQSFRLTCIFMVMDQIWLWYDYTCLPQRPLRYTSAALQTLFHRSLSALPIIQYQSHTFLLNSSNDYMTRAWCYAEFQNVIGAYGRSQTGLALSRDRSYDETKGILIIQYIVQGLQPLSDILHEVGLEFTNDTHSKKCTDAICWVLWNNMLRNPAAFLPLYYDWDNPVMCVGVGTRNDLSRWIGYIIEALEHPLEDKPRVSLTKNTLAALSYTMEDWCTLRQQIQEKSKNFLKVKPALQLDIEFSAEAGGLPNALRRALHELETEHQRASARGEVLAFVVVLVNVTPKSSSTSKLHRAARYDLSYEICSQDIMS